MLNEKTKVNLTIGKIVAIVIAIISMSFTIGVTYQKVLPDKDTADFQKKQIEEVGDIKITLARVTTILENMKEKQDDTRKDVSVLQDRTNKINEEVQVISSIVQMDKGKVIKRGSKL